MLLRQIEIIENILYWTLLYEFSFFIIGQLVNDDHHIRDSTRSRSRSKSKLDCNECCSTEQLESNRLARGDRSTQSTRSTRWEVYRHVDSPKKSLNSSQRRK